MKFSVAAAAVAAIASTSVQAFAPPMDFSSMLPELMAATTTTTATATAPSADLCWKNLFDRNPSSATTTTTTSTNSCEARGLERSGVQCFEKCASGYVGFGPFCMRDRSQNDQVALLPVKETSYRRQASGKACATGELVDGQCMEMCPAGSIGVGSVCAQQDCPAKLPFNCGGIACAKNAVVCSKEITTVTALTLKLVQSAQAGNWPAVIMLTKKLATELKDVPRCDTLFQQGQQAPEQVATQILEFLQSQFAANVKH